jgi:hypothetical protein
LFSKLPTGFGQRLTLFVSADADLKRLNVFSFQSVVVEQMQTTSISEVSTSSKTIKIVAANLATMDTTPKFKFDVSAAELSGWFSDSSIICHLPHGFRFQSRILATLGAFRSFSAKLLSNNANYTQFKALRLPTTGSSSIKIESVNFGTFGISISSRIGFSETMSTTWFSDSSMILRCSSGEGKMYSLKFSFELHSLSYSTRHISFFDVSISTVSVNFPTSGASIFPIIGDSFGLWSNSQRMRIGKTGALLSFWMSESHIFCKIAPFFEAHLTDIVLSSGRFPVAGKYAAIQTLKMIQRSTGTFFAFTGSNILHILGMFVPLSRSPFASLGISATMSSIWISDSAIATKNGIGCGNALYAKVSFIDRYVLSANIAARYQTPSVSNLSPSNAPTTGQSFITLCGTNLGIHEYSNSVSIHHVPNPTTKWTSDSVILSLLPGGYASPAIIIVSVNLLTAKFDNFFSYNFFSFSVKEIGTKMNASVLFFASSGSQMITVKGLDFGAVNPSVKLSHGYTVCGSSLWISDTILIGKISRAGDGKNPESIRVSVDLGWSTFTYLQSEVYEPFFIAESSFDIASPHTGSSFTFRCQGIRASDHSFKIRLMSTSVELSHWISDSSIKGKVSSLACNKISLDVVITGFLKPLLTTFSSDCKTLFNMGQSEPFITTGAAFSTISGSRFCSNGKTFKMRFGLSSALSTLWMSDSSLIIKTPVAAGLVLSVHASSESAAIKGAGTFYAPTLVSSISPRSVPITGSIAILFAGQSFGVFEYSLKVYARNRKFEQYQWTSDSSISGVAPPGMYQAFLNIDISGKVSRIENFLLPYSTLPILSPNGDFVGFPLLAQQHIIFKDELKLPTPFNKSFYTEDVVNVQPGDKKIGQLHVSVFLKMCFKDLENSTLIALTSSDSSKFGLKLGANGLFLFTTNFSDSNMFQVEREGYHVIVFRFDGETLQIYVDGSSVARAIRTSFQENFDLRDICILCREGPVVHSTVLAMLLFAMPVSDRDMDSIATWIGKKSQSFPNEWDATTASIISSIIPSEHNFDGSNVVTISALHLSVETANIQVYFAGRLCNITDIDLVVQVFRCVLPIFQGFATAELRVDGMTTYLNNSIKTYDPVINFIRQSPIVQGLMTITLIGLNFGHAENSREFRDNVLLRFGGVDYFPRESISVITQNNRLLEFNIRFDVTKYGALTSTVVSVEINKLQSNFASVIVPIENHSCQGHVSQRHRIDCCLRKCMHESPRNTDIGTCQSICSTELWPLQNECTSPEDVFIAQTRYGDCVKFSWRERTLEQKFDCEYQIRFLSSHKMYQATTKELSATFCGFLKHDLLHDAKVAAFNLMGQLQSWSKSSSFQIFDVTTPSRVLGLIVEELQEIIRISWEPPEHNGASVILKYHVIIFSNNFFVDCCTISIDKASKSYCVNVLALNSAGKGEIEEVCRPSSDHRLEIQNVENFRLLPGHSIAQEVPLYYNDISEVMLTVARSEFDVAFAATLSPLKIDLIATLSENACGNYSVVLIMKNSQGTAANRSFHVIARNSWTNLTPREISASSTTTITIHGCFDGISQSVLNIGCSEWNVHIHSSRVHQTFHEFDIISWNHTSCISSIALYFKHGDDLISIPFNNQLRSYQSQPSLSIRADIKNIHPSSLSSSFIKLLTVSGAGFTNVQIDWGIDDQAAGNDSALASMTSVLFRSMCETISTRVLLCDVPDWTVNHPAGMSSLIFYESDTGLEVLNNAGRNARVQFLPQISGITPTLAGVNGGSLVTLQGFGFNSSKKYILQNVDIQQKNLVFKLETSTILELVFEVPKWQAGPVETTFFELKDDSGNFVLSQHIEFLFYSNILKLFPTRTPCIQSATALITLSGIGFSPQPTYTAIFISPKQSSSQGFEMNSTCWYKNSKIITCLQVDWCLVNCAALLSIKLAANTGAVEYIVDSIIQLQIQYISQITEIRPASSYLSGSGSLSILGKGFPLSVSACLCMFQFRTSILNSSASFCNATTIICSIPSWGSRFAAQSVMVYFVSLDFAAPPPNSIAFEFVSSVSSIHPSIQSIHGGTLLFVEGSGFDENAEDFNCVFLQGVVKFITQFSVQNPGSGSCPTPFWNAANFENRTYQVKLLYGLNKVEMNAGIIFLA